MRITIIDVSIEKKPGKGGGYNQAEVTYKNDRDETKQKKIMSFANPAVFDVLQSAKKGDQFEVTTAKQGEFVNWTAAVPFTGKVDAPPEAILKASASLGRSNYETTEERASRQRLIVRQSSLSNAIEILTTGAKSAPDKDSVFALAEQLAEWVYKKPDLFDQPNDVGNDDIPF